MGAYNDDTDNYGASADLGAPSGSKTLGSVKAGGAASTDLRTKFKNAVQDAFNPVLDHLDRQVRGASGAAPDPDWEARMKAAGRRSTEPAVNPYKTNMAGARG